jgi:hypothetical protein
MVYDLSAYWLANTIFEQAVGGLVAGKVTLRARRKDCLKVGQQRLEAEAANFFLD